MLVLVFLAMGICVAEVPDLLGEWTGSSNGYIDGVGFYNQSDLNVKVVEQKDRVFAGNLTYESKNGTKVVEGFAGAIGLDNKTLYMAEFNEGFDQGMIIADDEIELIYGQDGKNGVVEVARLSRINA